MTIALARFAPERLRQWLPLFTLVVLVLIVGVLQPEFLTPGTLLGLASDTAVLFVLASGVSFVIMLGGIDLSIQSMASLASVVVALTLGKLGYFSFVLAVLLGAVAGCLGGLAHIRLKIPSFLSTLAPGGVLAGPRQRAAVAGDRRRRGRRHGDHRRRRQYLADARRGLDHFGRAHRHDLRRRRYLRPADRLRRRARVCGRGDDRPQQDPDRQV